MKCTVLILGALVAGLASVSAGHAEQLRYWGQHPETSAGLIELGPKEYSVKPGTEIPAWGRVKEVSDQRLIVEQTLTEDEKRRMREQGALPYDILQIHVPREDLRQPRGHVQSPGAR